MLRNDIAQCGAVFSDAVYSKRALNPYRRAQERRLKLIPEFKWRLNNLLFS